FRPSYRHDRAGAAEPGGPDGAPCHRDAAVHGLVTDAGPASGHRRRSGVGPPAPNREPPAVGTFAGCPTWCASPRFLVMSPRAAVVWTPEFLTYRLSPDHPLTTVRLDMTMRLA